MTLPEPSRHSLPPEDRGRVTRAAARRPLNVLMLAIGGVLFTAAALTGATALAWLVLPLTVLTYAALVVLAARDPIFQRRVLEGRSAPEALGPGARPEDRDVSPERRARWLPRGETRQKVEAALVTYRKVVAEIESADDVTRAVLGDALPKLHAAADRLVDVAERRAKADEAIRDLQAGEQNDAQKASLLELKRERLAADAEIDETSEQFLTLHGRVAQVALGDSTAARATARELSSSLDELNLRLEALNDTMAPPREPPESR